uniref:Response regulatory domain-containing protein n=1 Tax=Haptolina ericina TaxID=156174 RepID=A0A7S3AHA9_9EUKA|mmetsp:Transcript_18976/g.42410  ORF Transcript_18976/g.42410 Transcript_18976/m.42410 type:complete len:352 (+) Transcript_18976:41-1096(+)
MQAVLFSRYKSAGGVGIGLYLSDQLVSTFGSRLTVISPCEKETSSGTTFYFELELSLSDSTLNPNDYNTAGREEEELVAISPRAVTVEMEAASTASSNEEGPSVVSATRPAVAMKVDVQVDTESGGASAPPAQPRVAAARVRTERGVAVTAVDGVPSSSAETLGEQKAVGDTKAIELTGDRLGRSVAAREGPAEEEALPRDIRALIADDHRMNRKILNMIFTQFGWQVFHAETAEEVLDRIVNKKEKYDILIMDEIFITEQTSRCMLGSEAIKLLRPQLSGGEVIISCSGNYSEGNKGVIPQGADAVWCKPFPDFRDGSMQRQLLALFQARRAASAAAGDGPREGTLSMKV